MLVGFIDAAARTRDVKERLRLAHAIRQETQALGLDPVGPATAPAFRRPLSTTERHEALIARIDRVRAAGLEDIDLHRFPFLSAELEPWEVEAALERVALNDDDPAMPHHDEPAWHAEWRRWNDKCETERDVIRAEKQEAA
ncbi:MAG TPA: hypothetical protein VN817_06940 [Solirubrobacteraceae bacterium]|nr:hypothetical protein [Solirubrobacteraceae bacterium]